MVWISGINNHSLRTVTSVGLILKTRQDKSTLHVQMFVAASSYEMGYKRRVIFRKLENLYCATHPYQKWCTSTGAVVINCVHNFFRRYYWDCSHAPQQCCSGITVVVINRKGKLYKLAGGSVQNLLSWLLHVTSPRKWSANFITLRVL